MLPWLPFARRRSSRGSTQSGSSSSMTGTPAAPESAHRKPLLVPPPSSVRRKLFAPVDRMDLKALEKEWKALLDNKEGKRV